MTTTDLQQQIERCFTDVTALLHHLNPTQLDQPIGGGWSAGQCAEHIVLSTQGLPAVCRGKTQKTSRRPDEKIPAIRAVFLDFDQRFTSPDFVAPVQPTHDREPLIRVLNATREAMLAALSTGELGEECLDFEVPGFGPFTRFELLAFGCMHTQRHLLQLRRICETLNPQP